MNICMYGASSPDMAKEYLDAGYELGVQIARSGHALLFGGGANGMMGACARGADSKGGTIIGIAPGFFNVDGVLYDCTELIITETMRQRKQKMEDNSDAFVVTPGGIGTMDEFFDILTLKQLCIHKKPIVVLNINGFFDNMLKMLDGFIEEGILLESVYKLFYITDNPKDAVCYIENYKSESVNIEFYKKIGGNKNED